MTGIPPALSQAAFGAAALAALVFFLLMKKAERRAAESEERAAGLRRELAAMKNPPLEKEFRVELFAVIWFPTVRADAKEKKILKVRPGKPHCPNCVQPLVMSPATSRWECAPCRAGFADLAFGGIAKSINDRALKYFHERHPEFTLPGGLKKA